MVRMKTDIQPLQFNSLDYINALHTKQYRMNNPQDYIDKGIANDGSLKDENISIGFISQDVKLLENDLLENEVVADTENPDNFGLRYTAIIPILVDAMKKQQVMIDNLLNRIELLENV